MFRRANSSLRMRVIGASTVGRRLHLRDHFVHRAFAHAVGQDDQVGLLLALAGFALQHGIDADACVGQQARDLGEHAGLVGHAQAQVVAGHDLAHRQHGVVAHRIGLESQVRHSMRGVRRVQAGDVHQVGDHGAGRRLAARTLAVVQGRADGIGLHHHRIHRAFDIGDQPLGRHQRRVHPQLDALGRALGDAQELDAIAQLLGVADVLRAQLGDAFDIGLVELHRDAEGDRRHDGGLVRGVHPFDVEGGVGLGIAQALRLLEHHVEVQPLVAHLGQDEIGGAIDDAGDPLDAVGGEAFAQRLDDGDAAGHCRLECHHHAPAMRRGEDFRAMHGQQGLVGRDHMLARLDGLHDQGLGHAIAADQLDDDVDLGVGDDRTRIAHDLRRVADRGLRPRRVQVGHHRDLDAAAGAALDLFLVALQDVEDTVTDGAYAQQAYLDGFHDE